MNTKHFTLAEVFELIQYAVKQGYTGRISLLVNVQEDKTVTIDQVKNMIDDAVRIQNRHAENMQQVDFPAAGNQVPMTSFEAERLAKYLQRLELPSLKWDDVYKLSYNEAVARVKSFADMCIVKGMTPDEIDELYAYMQNKGVPGDQIDCRGKTLAEAKAEIDAAYDIASTASHTAHALGLT